MPHQWMSRTAVSRPLRLMGTLMARTEQTRRVNKAVKKALANPRPDPARSAQDRFLTQMSHEHRKVVVFLTNGIKLEGEIKLYDDYAILLEGAMTDHVYKHAVSTIQPLTGVVSRADVNVQESMPRVVARGAAEAAGAAEDVAAGAEIAAKEGTTRQPVIVIRPKRRLVKAATDKD
jgi:host factor-I protein